MAETADERNRRLYWMGRYIERTYTTIRAVKILAEDSSQESAPNYPEYCRRLGIPNVYSDTEDFLSHYLFDRKNPHSVTSSLNRAFLNMQKLGEIIPDETAAYIRMACQAMEAASGSAAAARTEQAAEPTV